MHGKSDSDVTNMAASSPPWSLSHRPMYYVQSPSRDDGENKSATPVYNSTSPTAGDGCGRVNEKGWPECNVIQEEGSYDGLEDAELSRGCQALLAFIAFVLLFTTLCLIIWGASRPYKPSIIVKSLSVDDFYSGEGTDNTGVPTKLITVNCSLKITV